MSYHYSEHRQRVFTEDGQLMLLKIRDRARHLLSVAGAFTDAAVTRACTGSSWDMLACVDRLVELEELTCASTTGRRQDWVYVAGPKWRAEA